MSCDPIWTVWCDVKLSPNCPEWHDGTAPRAPWARENARAAGWKRIDGEDICPACQAARARQQS